MKATTLLGVSIVAFGVPALALAQDRQEKKEDLEEVVVYGKNFVVTTNSSGKSDTPLIETPQSVSIISRDLLDSWDAGKLTEALRFTPGVNAEPFGIEPRFTSVRLRGFTANTESLYRDGLALRNPLFIVSYNLEPYGAERIEIPRGPASALYGLGSPGGLINYISKMPRPEAFGEVGLETDNYDRKQGTFDFGAPVGDSVSFRLTGLYREGDTQVDFVPDDRQYYAGALKWQIRDATSLTFLASYQDELAKYSQALPAAGTLLPNPGGVVPPSRFTGEPTFDRYARDEYNVGYQFEHAFTDSVRFLQNARYTEVHLDDTGVFSTGFLPDLRTMTRGSTFSFGDLESWTIDNQLRWAVETGAVRHKVLVGVDWQDADGRSIQTINTAPGAVPNLDIFTPVYGVAIPAPVVPGRDNDYVLRQLGFYVQDEIKINGKFVVNLAARYDDAHSDTFSRLTNAEIQTQDDTATTYRAGAVYLFDNGFAPYATVGKSYFPSVGIDAAGNPFEPETGEQWEVGLKYQPKSFDGFFSVAYFDLTRKNFVTRNTLTFQFESNGEGSTKGVEVDAYAALKNGLSLMANYNELTTNNDANGNPALVGKEFTQIPKTKASAWLDYNFRGGAIAALGIGFGARYQSSTFSDTLNTISSPSFTLYDAAIHYELNRFRVALNVQNLEDKIVHSSCFVRNQLLCTFGEARAVRGSVRYRW